MKKLLKTTPNVLKTSVKLLTFMISAIMVTPISQADVDRKQIGDLEIYKAAEGGKATLMMMLDFSGSMSVTNDGPAACELSRTEPYSVVQRAAYTSGVNASSAYNFNWVGCRHNGAVTTTDKKYYFKKEQTRTLTTTVQVWKGYATQDKSVRREYTITTRTYSNNGYFEDHYKGCGGSGSAVKTACTISTSTPGNLSSYDEERETPYTVVTTNTSNPNTVVLTHTSSTPVNMTSADGDVYLENGNPVTFYYPTVTTTQITTETTTNTSYLTKTTSTTTGGSVESPDRMTRLKMALYQVLDTLTPEQRKKIHLGIGQYSSASDSNNTQINTDGTTGKILVPAKELDDTQIDTLKRTIAKFNGDNGTPTANAYAEVGAYMLGTTTYSNQMATAYKEDYVKLSDRWYGCTVWRSDGLACDKIGNSSSYSLPSGYISQPCVLNPEAYDCGVRAVSVQASNLGMSGFAKSYNTTKNSTNYYSPLSTSSAQCDGQGIYFLTDGLPNNALYPTEIVMKVALGSFGSSFSVNSNDLNAATDRTSIRTAGWNAIGSFAKALRDTSKNPKNMSIRTAVVGFGSVFDVSDSANKQLKKPVLDKTTSLPARNPDGSYNYTENVGTYFDCNQIPSSQPYAKNACNWGAKSHPSLPGVGGYGEGGFYSAQSSDDVVNSIFTFIGDLNNEIAAAPSGVVTIPKDPYRSIGELPYALMPSLEAKVSGNNNKANIWPGNIKKYNLKDGTLIGQENQPVFKNVNGDLNTLTRDLWQSTTNYQIANPTTGILESHNEAVVAGGVFSNLKAPNSNVADTREVWIEDLVNTTSQLTTLRKLSIDSNGRPQGFSEIKDKLTYNRENQIRLLKYMGFEQAKANAAATAEPLDNFISKTVNISDLYMVKPSAAIKVQGASIHSKPVSVSYGARLVDGRVQNQGRDDYVLFGSMDGTLHLVKADDLGTNNGGKEQLAIIPRIMMQNQPDAFIPNSVYEDTTRLAGVPYFGIDGHWAIKANYDYNYANNKVEVLTQDKLDSINASLPSGKKDNRSPGLYAYGGMRLGGKGLLGFNLTNSSKPEVAFTSNLVNGALIDSNSSGFSRIGYIWNQPTITKMKTSTTDTGTDVVIFGGGYDKCYENENFQIGVAATAANGIDATCEAKTQAEGNAIYIINAKTGELIWSATYDATASGAFDGKKYMRHSIVGGITSLDRDNDGLVDELYFGDLGGQVFRVDFQDGIASSATGRVIRILKDNAEGTSDARRFYERPNVSFYRNGTKLFAEINIISGDRSSPLSKIRTTQNTADRFYGIIDTDVTLLDSAFFKNDFTPEIKDLVVDDSATSNFVKLGEIPAGTTKESLIAPLKDYTKKGWYYPLTRFDGYSNVKYTKGIGQSEVIGRQIYVTAFNPDMNYSTGDACSAKIVGGSERQMYCLPWGVCDDDASTNGTGGYERAGQGLQELNLGPQSSEQSSQRLIIGTQAMSDVKDTQNRTGWGNSSSKKLASETPDKKGLTQTGVTTDNGDGSMPRDIYIERYVLTPKRWYEQE